MNIQNPTSKRNRSLPFSAIHRIRPSQPRGGVYVSLATPHTLVREMPYR